MKKPRTFHKMFKKNGSLREISPADDSFIDVVKFVACGDLGPVRNLEPIAACGDSSHILGEIKPILKKADFVFANLETNFSKRGSPLDRIPVFRLDPAAFDLILQANVQIVSLANNHMFDYGPNAFTDTTDLLNKHNIKFFGAGLTLEDALRPVIIEIKSIKFGFIGFRDRESKYYSDNGVVTPQINKRQLFDSIDQIRDQVDWVVVSLHFGLEYRHTPNPDDVKLCRELVERGANIILGHHPHYPQGLEIYKKGLIVYSLGNFIWDQNFVGHTAASYIVEVSVTKYCLQLVKVMPFHMNKHYQLKFDINKEAFTKIEKLSSVFVDEKILDKEWYFITRDVFQIFQKKIVKKIFIDHQNPLSIYGWWHRQVGPRYKKVLKDFFKYVCQGKAFRYEYTQLRRKKDSRKYS